MSDVKTGKFRLGSVIAFAVCLIISAGLWMYVSVSSNTLYETSFRGVPVEIRNSSEYSVLSGYDATVDAVLEGDRNIIKKLERNDFTAYVVIDENAKQGKQKFDIQYELPNGVSGCTLSTSSITVYLDNTVTVSVPVEVKVTDYVIEDGYELDLSAVTTDIETVQITGPEATVSTITAARLTVSLGKVSKSLTLSDNLIPVNSDGTEVTGSFMAMSSTTATAQIPIMKYRDIPVDVFFKYGIFSHENCKVTVTPSSFRIRGESDTVDSVSARYEIDEKNISKDPAEYRFMPSLPNGVTITDGTEEIIVTVKATGISTKTVVLSAANINVNNPSNLSYTVKEDQISVILKGETDVIDKLQAFNIYAKIDLSGISSADGNVKVPVRFEYSDKLKDKIFEIGSYSLTVSISSEGEE